MSLHDGTFRSDTFEGPCGRCRLAFDRGAKSEDLQWAWIDAHSGDEVTLDVDTRKQTAVAFVEQWLRFEVAWIVDRDRQALADILIADGMSPPLMNAWLRPRRSRASGSREGCERCGRITSDLYPGRRCPNCHEMHLLDHQRRKKGRRGTSAGPVLRGGEIRITGSSIDSGSRSRTD
jgi:hypothetical protein